MKQVANHSHPAYWTCQGIGLWYGNRTALRQPFRFMSRPIGSFYQSFSHRLFTYLVWAACLIGGVFLAWTVAGQPVFIIQNLPLVCTLALYLALVFLVSFVIIDVLANAIWPPTMAYGRRNVGKQCLVLTGGLALGWWVHNLIFAHLLQLCAQPPHLTLPINPLAVPLLCASFYVCVLTVPMGQHTPTPGTNHRPQVRSAQAEVSRPQPLRASPSPAATVSFPVDGRQVAIPLKAISHISTEDHYCRIFYGKGQAIRDVLIRESLKNLAERLGPHGFLRIHRSHMINPRHITARQRRGTKQWLLMGHGAAPLPISRRRQAEVKEALTGQARWL